jgi:predicted molibdopterin-dependent oxidoreductase YjgC
VQRFHAAVAPPGDARPAWLVIGELLGLASSTPVAASAEAAFAALAGDCPAFTGLDYAALGAEGREVQTPR